MTFARALSSSALVLFLGGLAPSGAQAEEGSIVIEVDAPTLRAGDRAEVVVRVRGAGPHPLLLTPRSEGSAIEVVRGRLMRAEAADPSADVLEFRVPIIAVLAGSSVLRLRVDGYACREQHCRPVRAEASMLLSVLPSGT